MTPVVVVEIDIPQCTLTYGSSPCTAELGVTGDRKCFNLIRTCQDRENFTPATKTLRFCMPTEEATFTLNGDPVVVIPSIKSLTTTPGVINPGENIGQRESVRVTFEDHPHSDAGLDKYIADRDYDPFEQGTFWGKMRARIFSFEGYPFRVRRGRYGQDLSEMTVYHYVIDSITGQAETINLVAKDPLILTDKKKAQAPAISNGVLAVGIDADDTEATLSPSGIGDAEYPASGLVSIGGKELCSFTRSGDTLTLTRALRGTEAEEHDAEDRVQLVLQYDGVSPANIINHLLTTYTPGIDPDWIDLDEWTVEVDEYIDRLYSAEIAEPTPVVDLLNELIEQVGLVFWWDAVNQKIKLQSLRPVTDSARIYDENRIIEKTFKATEQPQKRVSEVWTYYGLRNPLEPLDEPSNYKAAIATVDAESSLDYANPAIKKIFSRWITDVNRGAASRINAIILSRHRNAPRKFSFDLFNNCEPAPVLGNGFLLDTWALQDDTGAASRVPAQFTSIEVRDDRYVTDAQESIFVAQEDLEDVRLIFIDSDAFNINLRTIYDSIYPTPESGDAVRCIIASGATVGGLAASSAPSLDVGSWPSGVSVEIVVNGAIKGRGGIGGVPPLVAAGGGTTALYTRNAVSITNNGVIAGGGGGGGGGRGQDPESGTNIAFGGGGGAGFQPGTASAGGENGTTTVGGTGAAPFAGDGGDLAESGGSGITPSGATSGGSPGLAVDGDSFVTWTVPGTIIGSQVN